MYKPDVSQRLKRVSSVMWLVVVADNQIFLSLSLTRKTLSLSHAKERKRERDRCRRGRILPRTGT